MNTKLYLALLHNIGISQKFLHRIFENDSNYKDFYETSLVYNILKDFGIRKTQINYILQRKDIINISFIEKKMKDRNVKIISIKDEEYPENLKQISNPPYLFYLRGDIDESPKISVVGARKVTDYGKKIVENIVPELAKYFVIISGGAYGVDTLSHKKALEGGTRTISVIGTGIDEDYPVGNKSLYDKIVLAGGGVISVFPFEEKGNPYNFPVRNEIVAGLSVGTLVVEAAERSGSLITAQLALDLGRDVFSVPGNIFAPHSRGCNLLIQKGEAKIVTKSKDILEEYGIIGNQQNNSRSKGSIKFADKIEESIFNALIIQNLTLDELSIKIGIPVTTLSFKISLMEINCILGRGAGGKYVIK